MPLPTLQQFEAPMYQPATMKLQAMGMEDRLNRTNIAQQGLNLQKNEFEETKKHNSAIELLKGYDFAAKNATNEEDFRRLVKETTGRETEVKFKGPDIDGLEVLGSDGKTYKMYGPKNVVFDAVDAISNDSSWLTDPQKRQQTMTHLKQNGVTVVPVKGDKEESGFTLGEGQVRFDKSGKQIASGPSKKDRPLVEVNVGEKGMTKLAEEMSKELVENRKEVEGSITSLRNISEAKKLLDSGIITGVGAKFLTDTGNLLSTRLGFQAFKDPVKNTEAYASIIGIQVGQIIKQFGSGTGLSDADREYAERIVAGDITLTETSLRKIISINEKGHKNIIETFNKKAKQAMKKKGSEDLPYDLTIELPTVPEPQKTAPQEAIDYLKNNPQLADQFKVKYGYLPEGF